MKTFRLGQQPVQPYDFQSGRCHLAADLFTLGLRHVARPGGQREGGDLKARVAALRREAQARSIGQSWNVSLQIANFMVWFAVVG